MNKVILTNSPQHLGVLSALVVNPDDHRDSVPFASSVYSVVKYRRRRTAFTLVELMTVLVIFAIVAGIGLPALLEIISGNGQTQASGQISAAVQRARSLALQLNAPVALVFFEESGYTGQTGMAYEVAKPGSAIGQNTPITFQLYPPVPTQFLPSGMYVAAFGGANAITVGSTYAAQQPFYTPFWTGTASPLSPYFTPQNLSPILATAAYTNASSVPYAAIVFNAQGQIAILEPTLLSVIPPDPSTSNLPASVFCPSVSAVCIYQAGAIPNPLPSTYANTAAYLTTNSDVIVFNPFTGSVIK
jgi:prepilin-type N-terminal cleavage/methylation domain-containing protein